MCMRNTLCISWHNVAYLIIIPSVENYYKLAISKMVDIDTYRVGGIDKYSTTVFLEKCCDITTYLLLE